MTRRLQQPMWRALVLGDGYGAHGLQTGSERQALALATALLKLAHGSERETLSGAFNVRAASLGAVSHPMPRLFRPLPMSCASRKLSRLCGMMFLASPMTVAGRILPESFVAGAPFPPPFDRDSDGWKTVIIAAGSATAPCAVLRKKQLCGAKLVQVLHPRCSLHHFDAVVTLAHDFPDGSQIPPNCITSAGSLHDLDAERLARHATRNPVSELADADRPHVALLLGGPRGFVSRLMHWRDKDATELAKQIADVTCHKGTVVISVSRRTPLAFTVRLQRVLGSILGVERVIFDDGRSRNRYLSLLGSSDAIIVTADSVNMLSEASATNAPVFIAGSVRSRRLRRFHAEQIERGNVRPLQGGVTIPFDGKESGSGHASEGLRSLEVDRVARAVWHRLSHEE